MQAVECGDSNSAGMGDAFEQHTHLMQPAHAQFLAHWLQLVDLEEGDLSAKRAEIWALPGWPCCTRLCMTSPSQCSRLTVEENNPDIHPSYYPGTYATDVRRGAHVLWNWH